MFSHLGSSLAKTWLTMVSGNELHDEWESGLVRPCKFYIAFSFIQSHQIVSSLVQLSEH